MGTAHATDLREFGKLLHSYRIAAQLTQEQLAELAGLSVHSISNLERGVPHLPRADTLHLLQCIGGSRMRIVCASSWLRLVCQGLLSRVENERPLEQPVSRIPLAPTLLIGRQAILDEIVACLSRPEVRLLTLVGSPGVGKTRLRNRGRDPPAAHLHRSSGVVLARQSNGSRFKSYLPLRERLGNPRLATSRP